MIICLGGGLRCLSTLVYVVFVLQETTVSICQSKVSETEAGLNEHTALNDLSGVPVITAVPASKVEQSEDWKSLEAEDWKSWKDEVSEPAAASLLAHSDDSHVVCDARVTSEPATTASNDEACDMRQMKTEQGLDYSTARPSASSSEAPRSSRVIVSVAPCTVVQSSEQLSPPKVPFPSPAPPLLHSTSHSLSSTSPTSPLPTSVIRSPVVANETSTLLQNDSDDSEQELRNRSPSPEPRLVNEERYRSKNAMYAIVFAYLLSFLLSPFFISCHFTFLLHFNR